MPLYRIPQEDFAGFTALAKLTKEKTKQLALALEKSNIGKSGDELAEELAPKIPIDIKDLHSIISVLYSIYILKSEEGLSEEDLLKDIIRSLKHVSSYDLKDREQKLIENLSQLLSLDGSIGLTIKTLNLGKEYEKVLVNSRILTDIRPAFLNLNKFENAIIVHNLKLEYHTGHRHEDIVLAVSSKGLKQLKEQIARAEKKEELVKKSLDKKINFISLKK